MGLYPALLITLQYLRTCKPNKSLNSLYVVASIQNVDITDLFEGLCPTIFTGRTSLEFTSGAGPARFASPWLILPAASLA
jgi:hypothetical protein